ncbi:MAG TPA: hypothetical protein PKV55_01320 [Nitrospira sp.]|jgi:hypothetical protein|nr:hypothetical protein [Nitrospira sp.]MBS0161155.1 hypothetical protein [Nitrospira sp.]MBS0175179.1 hypothetical protein [Nitrospira sp.]MBS0179499.1 hypothetical protein [Nitrospira sp.]MBX3336723.1 hypothetical protein [Nitrospira sp.]
MGEETGRQLGSGTIESLREEFRGHLALFYSRLKLAAPYDSVEKALGTLTKTLKALPPEELNRLSSDTAQRWTHFRVAFVESGLNLKHRGIIAGLAQSETSLDLPEEFNHLLNLYRRPS